MNSEATHHAACCELVCDVARNSSEVRVKVTGISMLPAVWPGDVVTVRRCDIAELQPGQILLCHREGKLTVHRIRHISRDQVVTRGDSLPCFDPPVRASEIAGQVVSILRNGRRIHLEHSFWQRLVSQVLQRSNFCVHIALLLGSCARPSGDMQVSWPISSPAPVTKR
jgi:signal peptidase